MIIDLSKSRNFLINLDKDKKRLENSSRELNNLNIPFQRFSAIAHPKGIVGCGMSHLSLLSSNRNTLSSSPLLVMEDDIKATSSILNIVFEVPDDTDALYLGISKYGFIPSVNFGILNSVFSVDINKNYKRVFNMCSTHAIVYTSESYLNSVIDIINYCLSKDIAFDLGIASIHKNFNILTPKEPLFFQKEQQEVTHFVLQ
jgi:hypothetical protein